MGGPQFRAELIKSGVALDEFAASEDAAGKGAERFTKRTFAQNQALFMARRGLFYASLAAAGLGFEIVKMGFEFNNTMQQASVAFTKFLPSQEAVTKEMHTLYLLAAQTPFQFPDIVLATRRLIAFGVGVKTANALVTATTNSLSAMGITTGAALSRAALAISHMYAIGHLNGQILLQMGRDNILMQQALQWKYKQTGDVIKQMVSSGQISAQQAAEAYIGFMKTPQYNKAAWDQANKTIFGAWSTFKDFVRMGSASSQSGLFSGLLKAMQRTNDYLNPIAKRRNITLTDVATGLDKGFTPQTHVIIEFFTVANSAIRTLIGTLKVFLGVLGATLTVFDKLTSAFGANHKAAKILGAIIGVMTGIFLINKAVVFADKLMFELWAATMYFVRGAVIALNIVTDLLTGKLKLNTLWSTYAAWAERRRAAAAEAAAAATTLDEVATSRFSTILFTELIPALVTWAATMWAELIPALIATCAWLLVMAAAVLADPITWIVVGVIALGYALVVLYTRWKAFHDAVNNTVNWLIKHWWIILDVLLPGLGIGLKMLTDHWKEIYRWIRDAYDMAVRLYNKISHPFHVVGGFFGRIAHYASYALPAHAIGGTIAGPQMAIVGERGPEIVRLPGGSNITPNPPVSQLDASSFGGGDNRPIVVNLVVDRKVLAQAVARANQDYASRR